MCVVVIGEEAREEAREEDRDELREMERVEEAGLIVLTL